MSRINLRRSLATVSVIAGALVAIHAGGGWDPVSYQHDQTDLEFVALVDGTSNTMMFGERARDATGGMLPR
jgi:hypothetical protein